tara:strand:+ start:1069 stop:1788 length:720 start_codon:yes stop_codon:yes gene_type:complete
MINKLDKNDSISLLKKHFSESWIEELSDDYKELLKGFGMDKHPYFHSPGDYDRYATPDTIYNKYFRGLLSKAAVDVVLVSIEKNELFKNTTFVDNGSGFGLLSIFLDKIGIKCFNYDPLTHYYTYKGPYRRKLPIEDKIHLGDISYWKDMFKKDWEFYKKYNIEPPKTSIKSMTPVPTILCSCEMYVDREPFDEVVFDYLLLDGHYGIRGSLFNNSREHNVYELIDSGALTIDIFRRRV